MQPLPTYATVIRCSTACMSFAVRRWDSQRTKKNCTPRGIGRHRSGTKACAALPMDPRSTLSLGLNRRRSRYSPVKIIAAHRNVFELVTEGRYLNDRMQREKFDFVSPAMAKYAAIKTATVLAIYQLFLVCSLSGGSMRSDWCQSIVR